MFRYFEKKNQVLIIFMSINTLLIYLTTIPKHDLPNNL